MEDYPAHFLIIYDCLSVGYSHELALAYQPQKAHKAVCLRLAPVWVVWL